MKLHIKKNDKVIVLAGDSKGQSGEVREVDYQKNRAIVTGVNMSSRHTKPNTANPQGGIIKTEAPVHLSNLMLIEPGTGKPTRTGRKAGPDGKLVRYSKKTGEVIK
jgi:large subunit ribosomal protein L24